MNIPNLFKAVSLHQQASQLLKGKHGVIKFFRLGEAPQDISAPFAVWQVMTGVPYNTLDGYHAEKFAIMIDVYGATYEQCTGIVAALESALRDEGTVTAHRNLGIEPETRLVRFGFDFDAITIRSKQNGS